MKNLKNWLLEQPLQLIPKWIPVALLVLALAGFADATYITVEHFSGVIPPCAIGGCETVLTSKYSEIWGVPVSLLGAIYYFIISLSLFFYFDSKKDIFLKFPMIFSVCGLLASIYFVSLMAFVLTAFCLYCAFSATSSTLLFILSIYAYRKYG